MRIVLLDTGRGRTPATIEAWRAELALAPEDEVALIAWQHPRGPLPVVEHLVFGPRLHWLRPEPVRPIVTEPRLSSASLPSPTAGLPLTDPRRVAAAVAWRLRRVTRPLARSAEPLVRRFDLFTAQACVSSSGPVGAAVRRRLGVNSDGIATDFAVAVARSRAAASLAAWADVLVPMGATSRKSAWVLARRAPGPQVPIDVTAAARAIRERRLATTEAQACRRR